MLGDCTPSVGGHGPPPMYQDMRYHQKLVSKPTDEQPRKSPTREGDITAQKIRLARGNPSQDDELEVFEVTVNEQPCA